MTVDGAERVGVSPWRARPTGMLIAGILAVTSSAVALVLVFTSALWPVVLTLLLVSSAAVAGTWWARRRRRLEPPAGHRAAVVARFLHAWSAFLCLLTAGPLALGSTGPGDPADLADLAFPLAQSVLVSAMFAQFRSTRHLVDPAGQRPGGHLTRRQRREIAGELRADRVLDATRDRDVRAVIQRLLDRELAGWGAVAAAVLLLTLVPQALETSPWLALVTGLGAAGLGVLGWQVLAVVRAAKRRQVWLNAHRPAPHLERPARDDAGRNRPPSR